jgi:ribosomal protein L40E
MSVRQAILDFTGGEIRPRIFISPAIPEKKLAAAKSQFAFGDEKIIALYDDTVFGSAKDGIAVTETYIYAKQLWESPRSVKISSIKTITTESKLLDNLDILINGNFFTSISSLPKADQPFLLGILMAARDAAAKPKAKRVKASPASEVPQAAVPKDKAKGTKSEATMICNECSAQLPKGAKFCLECGAKVMPKGICMECNAKLPEKAKFCPECGAAAGKAVSKPAQPKVSADALREELSMWLSASEVDARIDSDGDLSLNITAPTPSVARDARGWIGKYDIRIDAEGVHAESTEECACFGPNEEFYVSSPYCRVGMQSSAAYEVAMKLQMYTLNELEVHEIELREGVLAIPELSSPRVKITNLSARRDDDGSYEITYALDAYAGHAVHFQVSAEKPDADGSAWARVEQDESQSGTYWLWDVKPGQKLYVCFGEYKLLVDGVEASFSGTADAPEGGYENATDDDHQSDYHETLDDDAGSGGAMDWKDAADRAFNYYFNAIRKGEDSDTAAEWFKDEIAQQTEQAGISYDYGWPEEVSPEQMRIMSDSLANRIRGLNDEQGYSVSSEFYHQFTSFMSNLIYDRRQADDADLEDLQNYWDEGVWKELPAECGEGYLNSSDSDVVIAERNQAMKAGDGYTAETLSASNPDFYDTLSTIVIDPIDNARSLIKANPSASDLIAATRAFLERVIERSDHHEDMMRDACEPLVAADGPYSAILGKAYERNTGEPYDPEDGTVTFDDLADYMTYSEEIDSEIVKYQFAYRMIEAVRQTVVHMGEWGFDIDINGVPDLNEMELRVEIERILSEAIGKISECD